MSHPLIVDIEIRKQSDLGMLTEGDHEDYFASMSDTPADFSDTAAYAALASEEVSPPPAAEETASQRGSPQSSPRGSQRASAAVPAFSVQVVLVVSDPSAQLDETLTALAAQDYPNLSVAVALPKDALPEDMREERQAASAQAAKQAASAAETQRRIAAILPEANVCHVFTDSFGAAANAAIADTPEADRKMLFLFCRHDVVLQEDTVSRLVAELEKINAGIVAPKLLDRRDAARLADMGFGVSRSGGRLPKAVPGELDQGQRDRADRVFGVSSACMLIRSDLFFALGQFSTDIAPVGEDMDICWRAHLAQAQVVVATDAKARMLPQPATADEARLRMRHQVFSLLTCPAASAWFLVVLKAIAVHLVGSAAAVIYGRSQTMLNISKAWAWSLARPRKIRQRRQQIKPYRLVGDEKMRQLQDSSLEELKQFMRANAAEGGIKQSVRRLREWGNRSATKQAVLVWVLLLAVIAFGSRHLLTRGIPEIGEMVALPSQAGELFSQWFSSLQTGGLGRDGFSSIALGALGIFSSLLFGAMGLARTLMILGMIPLGALGIARLLRGFGSRRVGWVGAAVYVALPLPYNAVAKGAWSALVLYGLLPWIVSLAATRLPGDKLGVWRRVVALGILTALAASFVPFAILLLLGCVAALAVGTLFVGARAGRLAGIGAAGALAGLVLAMPFASGYFSWSALVGADIGSDGASPYTLWELIRFATGPINESWLGWGMLLAAALPLLVVRDARFVWVIRGWALVCVSVGVAWLGERGWLSLPDAEILLVPAGVGFAIAVAMGMAALESDLPSFRFGWRQLVPFAGAAALVILAVPVLGASFDGRWNTAKGDYAAPLSALSEDSYRVLWLGHPDVLPGKGQKLTDDLGYALTTGVSAQTSDLWNPRPNDKPLKEAVVYARDGLTNRLGRLLSQMGIRYVAVADSLTPPPHPTLTRPLPAWLRSVLNEQLDMRRVDLREGIVVYENLAAAPLVLAVAEGSLDDTAEFSDIVSTPLPEVAASGICEAADVDFLGCDVGPRRAAGSIGPRSDVYVASGSARWRASVETAGGSQAARTQADRSEAFGWAQAFDTAGDRGGVVTVSHSTPAGTRAAIVLQLAVWILALAFLAIVRRAGGEAHGGELL